MENRGGTLKSTSINGVKMYSVSGSRSVATWLPPKKQRELRKDKDYQQRMELIQDLRFETATTKIKATPDGEFLIASGIYPPQVKVYELRELSLKFERHLISEIIDFQVLSDDYSKLAFLCADRSVCLHAKYGSHYSLRIPRMGRDMAYDSWSCDLLCAASSPDLYRINLEQGRFLTSLSTKSPALNVVSRSKLHGLVACGGEDGAVECFDMRMKSSVGRINAVAPAGDIDQEVTALEFDEDGGFLMAVGDSAGKGDGMTSIEPAAGIINDICVFRESGLILLALDGSQIPSYFVPALGPAPKWCSYLENMTEELEEGAETSIYDDFKFLTIKDLERLNLQHLIGTNLLRAYMHGFFIDYRLYKKAQSLADPFAYEAYIEQKKKEKMEAERASRITITKKLPKVNRELAAKIIESEAQEAEVKDDDATDNQKKSSKRKKGLSNLDLNDERFADLFRNKDFEVVESSQEYRSLHPMPKKQPDMVKEHFEPIMEEDEEQSDSDVSTASQSSDDYTNREKNNVKRPRLYEVKDERHADAFMNRVSTAAEDDLPLGERVAAASQDGHSSRISGKVKVGPGGSREISFVSRSSAKYKEDWEEEREAKKRGIQSLGLKSDRSDFGGRGGRGRGGGGGRGRGRGRGRGGGGGRGRRGGGGGGGRGRGRR
ncbi:hypothetical protein AQUCO_04100065v1 [Aquilegia coerulea]|uniref:Uncharacterized protein n=1 Tax=Aquilegia coerulea TaxID=218851 RepID=A0A2G5CRA0_AQUCA|nr:hypothetical protein AQUCO_04100065v1 [Aquilegia coerulea]